MRVSVCVGSYAETPYCVPGLEIKVYCIEELCYCLKEHAFLLDLSLLNDELLWWIEHQCGLRELAARLYPLVHKRGSLSLFAVTILEYVGLYDEATVQRIERLLKQGAGLSSIEKRKNQIDYLVKKKKYVPALKGYEMLLQKWKEMEGEGAALPAVGCLASVWNNRGVAFAGMMLYEKAAECFKQAYELVEKDAYCMAWLAAKRMALSEADYLSFIAGHGQLYQYSLELEKKIEKQILEWEKQPEYLQLYNRREQRAGDGGQSYREDNIYLLQALKDNYRRSVSD